MLAPRFGPLPVAIAVAAGVPGERVTATGTLRTPHGLRDPAVPDRAAAAHARGAALELTARSLERRGDAAGLTTGHRRAHTRGRR